ncbi:MAG TPA: hypothetical protein PKA13_10040 [Geminicoccaceae bacterium]|nr:hypothetical protein [Geminicoccus sp.]HMU50107.1 hypothetical protein [Geminicoccaceae bacterium]
MAAKPGRVVVPADQLDAGQGGMPLDRQPLPGLAVSIGATLAADEVRT